MKVVLAKDSKDLGYLAAKHAAREINAAIAKDGNARILLSTGASQFTFFEQFVKEDIDWAKVEMFHLDEYVGITTEHPASFKKYLTEKGYDRIKKRATPAGSCLPIQAWFVSKQIKTARSILSNFR